MLSKTSLFLLIPLFLFAYKEDPPIEEFVLAALLLINLMLSIMFWTTPVRHSTLHVYDALFAKISYVAFVVYILFLKDLDIKWIFVLLLLTSMTLFYYSHVHSSQSWCSREHVACHAVFHIITSAGCSMAFL